MADLVEHTCGNCGCVWGFPREMLEQRKKDGQLFYCPNGHGRHFVLGKTAEQKLQEQLDEERRKRQRAEQNIAMWADDAREQRERADKERRRANGYKGHATRITKRASAGVCPCCNRTFQQLAQHMATQHPQFTPMELEQRPPEASVQ